MLLPHPLAGHRVLRLLAVGARSRVWLAEGDLVLKELSEGETGRLVDEVAALERAAGEHVVPLLDVSAGEGRAVLVFPRLARGSLADVLAAPRPLAGGEAVTALVPVVQALARMHRAGVAHGALAPGAVLLRADGAPVLTGFGSAVRFEPGLPEVLLERVEAVAADRAALAALAAGALRRVSGPRAAAAAALADRVQGESTAELEERLAVELFALATACPLEPDRAGAGPGPADTAGDEGATPAPAGRVVRVQQVEEPREEPPVQRSPLPAWVPAGALAVLESGPVALVRREARRRWEALGPSRRRVVLAVAAGATVLLVLTALPGGGPDPAAMPVVSDSPTAFPSQPLMTAADPEDPLAALAMLLARREECFRALSVLCLTEVDQDGSAAAAADRGALEAIAGEGSPVPGIDAEGARIAERMGDTVLIELAAGSDPSAILLMRTDAGWRIRDYLAPPPGAPEASDAEVSREVPALQPVLHRGEETRGVGPVHDAVIVGERQVHHRADGDGVETVVAHHHGLLLHDSGAEDRDLGQEDDRRIEERPS